MAIKLNPYISFKDNAKEAMEFYKGVFGGELKISTFKDFDAAQDPSEESLTMHAVLETPELTLMASDSPKRMGEYKPLASFSVSLSGEASDESKLRGWFEQLSKGGNVTMPLEKAIWGDTFGMLVDQFGVSWLVNIAGPGNQTA